MQMQVIHTLPRVAAGVGHDAVALTIQALIACHFGRECQQPAEQSLAIFALGVTHRRDVPSWYHQQVHRRLRVDVPERQGMGRAFDDPGGNLTRHDPAKETVSHGALAALPFLPLPPPPRQRSRNAGC